jgi:hypothetical protein
VRSSEQAILFELDWQLHATSPHEFLVLFGGLSADLGVMISLSQHQQQQQQEQQQEEQQEEEVLMNDNDCSASSPTSSSARSSPIPINASTGSSFKAPCLPRSSQWQGTEADDNVDEVQSTRPTLPKLDQPEADLETVRKMLAAQHDAVTNQVIRAAEEFLPLVFTGA